MRSRITLDAQANSCISEFSDAFSDTCDIRRSMLRGMEQRRPKDRNEESYEEAARRLLAGMDARKAAKELQETQPPPGESGKADARELVRGLPAVACRCIREVGGLRQD